MLIARAIIAKHTNKLAIAPCLRLFTEQSRFDKVAEILVQASKDFEQYSKNYKENVQKQYAQLMEIIKNKKVSEEQLISYIAKKEDPKDEEYKKCIAIYTKMFGEKIDKSNEAALQDKLKAYSKQIDELSDGKDFKITNKDAYKQICENLSDGDPDLKEKLMELVKFDEIYENKKNEKIEYTSETMASIIPSNLNNTDAKEKSDDIKKKEKMQQDKLFNQLKNNDKDFTKLKDENEKDEVENIYEPRGIYRNLGIAAISNGHFEEAQKYFENSNIENEKIKPIDIEFAVRNLVSISGIYNGKGENEKELDTLQKAIKLFDNYDKAPDKLGKLYENIGIICHKEGKYKEAIENFHKANVEFSKSVKLELHDRYELSIFLGTSYFYIGSYKEALKHFNEGLPGSEKDHGKDNPAIFSIYNMLAICYFEQQNFNKSVEYFDQVVKIYKINKFKLDDGLIATIRLKIFAHMNINEDLIAQKLFEEYRLGLENLYKKDSKEMGEIYRAIGSIYLQQMDYEKANMLFEPAASSIIATYGKESIQYAQIQADLIIIMITQGKVQEAEAGIQELLALLEKKSESATVDIGQLYETYGMVFHDKGFDSQSAKYLTKAMDIVEKKEKDSHSLAEIYYTLGLIENKKDLPNKAFKYLNLAKHIFERKYGLEHQATIAVNLAFAIALEKSSKFPEAMQIYKTCYTYYQKIKQFDILAEIVGSMAKVCIGQKDLAGTITYLQELHQLLSESTDINKRKEADKIKNLLSSFNSHPQKK